MPLYEFRNTETNEIFEKSFTIADKEIYLQENPHIKQIHTTGIKAVGGVEIRDKVPDGFKEVLSKVKSHHPKSNIRI